MYRFKDDENVIARQHNTILFFYLISHQVFGAVKVNSITASQVMINLTVKQYTEMLQVVSAIHRPVFQKYKLFHQCGRAIMRG